MNRKHKSTQPQPVQPPKSVLGHAAPCTVCGQHIYRDESYELGAYYARHIRCSHGPAPRPPKMGKTPTE